MTSVNLLTEQIAELKTLLQSRLSTMELAVKEAEAMAEETREGYKVEVCNLKAQIEEKEKVLHERDGALKELDLRLTTNIHELENRLRKREQRLETRDAELKGLRSELRAVLGRITEKEANFEQAEVLIKGIKESLKVEFCNLKTQIKEKEDPHHEEEPNMKKLEANVKTKLNELENAVGVEASPGTRDGRPDDLKPEIDALRSREQEIVKFQEQTLVQLEGLISRLQKKRTLLQLRERKQNQSKGLWRQMKQWVNGQKGR
jgi:chromosome segregation ATPase